MRMAFPHQVYRYIDCRKRAVDHDLAHARAYARSPFVRRNDASSSTAFRRTAGACHNGHRHQHPARQSGQRLHDIGRMHNRDFLAPVLQRVIEREPGDAAAAGASIHAGADGGGMRAAVKGMGESNRLRSLNGLAGRRKPAPEPAPNRTQPHYVNFAPLRTPGEGDRSESVVKAVGARSAACRGTPNVLLCRTSFGDLPKCLRSIFANKVVRPS